MEHRIMFLGNKKIGIYCYKMLKNKKCKNIQLLSVGFPVNECLFEVNINTEKKCEKDIISEIRNKNINTIISVQHNWLISEEVIKSVNGNIFNLHMAKLPKYRGYYGINHAILNGDKQYTVTMHYIDSGVDTGDIILERSFAILPDDTAEKLYRDAEQESQVLFSIFLEYLCSNKPFERKKQIGETNIYAKQSITPFKEIKFMNQIDTKFRAFDFEGYEPAFIMSNGKKYFLVPENKWRKYNKKN